MAAPLELSQTVPLHTTALSVAAVPEPLTLAPLGVAGIVAVAAAWRRSGCQQGKKR